MLQRIVKGWTITRAIYIVIGTLVIFQSVENKEWIGILFGGYFAAMGLFAFGCASGNCYGSNCRPESNKTIKKKGL